MRKPAGISRRPRGLFGAVALIALLESCAAYGNPIVDPNLWGTNGTVNAIARSGNTLFIGGSFTSVGPCMGGGVPLDLETGLPRRPFPRVNGRVTAVVSDGAGGWFVGGHFSAVEGAPHMNLAHVLTDGSVSPWSPIIVGGDRLIRVPDRDLRRAGVDALVLSGHTLYVAGLFVTVNGQARNNIAAFDAASGALRSWDPDANGEVRCIAARSNVVYAGGEFTVIGGQPRSHVAALEARTGVATDWNPSTQIRGESGGSRVRSLTVDGNLIYVAGDFDSVGGQARNSIAAVDVATGKATSWDAKLGPARSYIAHGDWYWPYVEAAVVHSQTVYFAGRFDRAGGQPRWRLAALDTQSGLANEFDAQFQGVDILGLAFSGNTLYAVGSISRIGGEIRSNLAALDGRTGRATEWNPGADGVVETIATDGSTVYVGGTFTSVHDFKPRYCIAALDLTTGEVTPWAPRVNGAVRGLGVIGHSLYMTGDFTRVDGELRSDLAAEDTRKDAVLPWYEDPLGPISPSGWPTKLVVAGDKVYVAGYFYGVGGQDRNYLAQLDATTGQATAWDAHSNGEVRAVLPAGNVVYVGGDFGEIAGHPHPNLVALDPVTAAALPWDPPPVEGVHGQWVFALAAQDGTIYLGGRFAEMGGEVRCSLAAVDSVTGALRAWAPNPNDDVETIGIGGSGVWVGGRFTRIGGQERPYLAGLDATTGTPIAWDPRVDGEVTTIASRGDTLYVGGAFRSLQGIPHSSIAAILPSVTTTRAAQSTASTAAPDHSVDWLGPSTPNPARPAVTLRFMLQRTGVVSLVVYDLEGRRIETLLDHAAQTAGEHDVSLRTEGWRPGVYFFRLEMAGRTFTRKLVVAR